MDRQRLQIAVLFIIVFLSYAAAILIELLTLTGQLSIAIVSNSLSPTLERELTEIANALNQPQIPWILCVLFSLHLLVPVIAIVFNNRLSAWIIFALGILLTISGTIHGLGHALSGEVYMLVLALLTVTIPGIYGVVLAYDLAKSSPTTPFSLADKNIITKTT